MPKLLRPPTPCFYLHSKSRTTTSIILSVVMPYKGKMHRFKYHFGCSIETRFWDPKKQRPRLVGKNYEYLGSILEQIKAIESLCNDILKEHNFSISPKKLKQELDTRRGITKKPVSGESAKPVIPTLMQFLDIYLEERKNAASYKWGSWKVLHTWATHLKDFSATQRKPLDYADINSQFLPVFKNWLCAPERYPCCHPDADYRPQHRETVYAVHQCGPQSQCRQICGTGQRVDGRAGERRVKTGIVFFCISTWKTCCTRRLTWVLSTGSLNTSNLLLTRKKY